ncbi:MAG TPA: hypothetical protein VFX57_01045, partial [Sulfuricurvum sp.]|nr:hypothetical protein [Sulfuricurvum sp.]
LAFAASDRKLTADKIDFDLLSCETYFKGPGDKDWVQLTGDNLLGQTTEENIRSGSFSVRQEYQICIRPFAPHPLLDLRFSLASDKTKSKVIAIIDPASTIPLKKGVQAWIKDAIVRKQLRLGFMIGIADVDFDKEITRLLATIQKNGPLTAPYRMLIAQSFPPVEVINDAVILHYKQLNRNNSFIEGVQPGDLLLEYIFPVRGRDGRGCDGIHIPIPDPTVQYADFIRIDEATISQEQDEKSRRYYAKVSGFVKQDDGIFSVAQELYLESASMKTTGSIEAGTDKDISLTIEQKNSSEDAVGIGVSIDVQTVDITGTVGENTKILAQDITIGAQTHKKSKIDATEVATIQLHRGDLKARIANIDILEGGRIEADSVRIKKMLGGEIIARTVHIEELYSNSKITALESIEVNHIEGDGNSLIIDPASIPIYYEKITAIKSDIQAKNTYLKEQKNELIARQQAFKEQNSRIQEMKRRILIAQKSNDMPMKADMVRIRQYQSEANKLSLANGQLREEEVYLEALQSKLEKVYEADIHAVITHHGTYNGHNRVVFIDPETRQEYATTPKGNIPHIRLHRKGDEKHIVLNP